MRRLSTILAAVFFLTGTVEGRIGETEEQIGARYGKPITVLPAGTPGVGLTKCYSAQSLIVSVTFLNGQSVHETIAKADRSSMAGAEIQSLLQANASDSSAVVPHMTGPRTVSAGVQEWRSVDQPSRIAFYDSQTRALFITTQKFIDLTNARKRQVTVRDGGGFGTREQPHPSLKALEKSNAITMRRGQAKPSGSPASK